MASWQLAPQWQRTSIYWSLRFTSGIGPSQRRANNRGGTFFCILDKHLEGFSQPGSCPNISKIQNFIGSVECPPSHTVCPHGPKNDAYHKHLQHLASCRIHTCTNTAGEWRNSFTWKIKYIFFEQDQKKSWAMQRRFFGWWFPIHICSSLIQADLAGIPLWALFKT